VTAQAFVAAEVCKTMQSCLWLAFCWLTDSVTVTGGKR